MKLINAETATNLLESTRAQGSIFSVTFVKRTTGDVRTMNARLGVKKGVTGVGMAYNPKSKNLMACYDVQKAQEMKAQGLDSVEAAKKSYRMINLDDILSLKVGGVAYSVFKTDTSLLPPKA